jgi:hypothetical protein
MPIYNVTIESLDGSTKEDIELAGSTMKDFTTVNKLNGIMNTQRTRGFT